MNSQLLSMWLNLKHQKLIKNYPKGVRSDPRVEFISQTFGRVKQRKIRIDSIFILGICIVILLKEVNSENNGLRPESKSVAAS